MVNIAQNEVLPSEQEAHQAISRQTVNWKGGKGRNVEAELKQENRKDDHKQESKRWVPTRLSQSGYEPLNFENRSFVNSDLQF